MMKIAANFAFSSALLLTAFAPSFSHAAYFVDQTKTWAIGENVQDVTAKGSASHGAHRSGRHALAMDPRSGPAFISSDLAVTGGGSIG